MSCEEALREIARRKLLFGKDLVKKVVECEEASELIVKLADELDEISDGWFSVHTIFILSIIGNYRAFEALKAHSDNKKPRRLRHRGFALFVRKV